MTGVATMRFHLKAVGKTGVVSMTVEAQGDSEARRMVEDQGMRVVSLQAERRWRAWQALPGSRP